MPGDTLRLRHAALVRAPFVRRPAIPGTANLFIVPLDNERRWYRYHRLFADLLRQRLQRIDCGRGGLSPARQSLV